MAISVAMFAFLYVALKKTRIGLVIQAALTHPQMVSALGHDVPGVFVLVFAIGSALAGLAGVIGGFMLLTQPTLAHAIGPIVFVVVVVGGLGSLSGALIASMLIGILQTFAVAVDYSLLDLLRALGVALTRASPFYELRGDQARDRRADRPVPAARADARSCARAGCSGRATYERLGSRRGVARRCRARSRGAHPALRAGSPSSRSLLHSAARARARFRLRALAPHADGDRRGVRVVVQPAVRADRPAVVRPRRLLRSRRATRRST